MGRAAAQKENELDYAGMASPQVIRVAAVRSSARIAPEGASPAKPRVIATRMAPEGASQTKTRNAARIAPEVALSDRPPSRSASKSPGKGASHSPERTSQTDSSATSRSPGRRVPEVALPTKPRSPGRSGVLEKASPSKPRSSVRRVPEPAKWTEVKEQLSPTRREFRKPGIPSLHEAAGKGLVDRVQQLLEAGAEIDVQDTEGCSPLCWAAREGQIGMVRLLCNAGANVDPVSGLKWQEIGQASDGKPAKGREVVSETLSYALQFSLSFTVDECKRLQIKGLCSDDSIQSGNAYFRPVPAVVGERTPLMVAAANGHVEVVRLLLAAGAGRETKDERGWTALYMAKMCAAYSRSLERGTAAQP